jgi:3-oxoacid CoA-transferase subunit B
MGVFDVTSKGLVLIEKANEVSVEDIKAVTEAEFTVADNLKVMGI